MSRVLLAFLILIVSSAFSFAGYGQCSRYGDRQRIGPSRQVHILQLKRAVQTDDSRNYRLAGIPPGRYTILVHKEVRRCK